MAAGWGASRPKAYVCYLCGAQYGSSRRAEGGRQRGRARGLGGRALQMLHLQGAWRTRGAAASLQLAPPPAAARRRLKYLKQAAPPPPPRSLHIHLPACAAKFAAAQALLPPRDRKAPPPPPPELPATPDGLPKRPAEVDAFNQAMFMAYKAASLNRCGGCGRTFK